MRISDIEILVDLVAGANVSEVTVEGGGRKVTVRKALRPRSPAPRAVPCASAAPPTAEEPVVSARAAQTASIPSPAREPVDERRVITASMVGVFHRLEEAVRPGTRVDKGQVIGVIESMKLMNDVRAGDTGVVAEVLVEDGMPVEYGQPILVLE